MPSWRIHKKWSKRVCNFYSEEIDRLIDNPQQHDAGRYDEKIFLEQIEYVASKYGRKGVECYLLHHLLDRLKDELVSIKSRHGEVDLEHVKRILSHLKPEPMWKIKKYDEVWTFLILKLKPKLGEVVDDIMSEMGFKRSYRRAVINKWVSSWTKIILDELPPCIQLTPANRVFVNSRALKVIWDCVPLYTLEDRKIVALIMKTVAEYIKENRLYRSELCSKKCEQRLQKDEKWRKFVRSLKIPCPKIE